jgi:hypothetical protein
MTSSEPRYREGVMTMLMALAYATRKNQDEEVPERMEIDVTRMRVCIESIIGSSFLTSDNKMRLPADPSMKSELAELGRLVCE